MAVATTGAIYKSLIFDDIESRNFGVYITGEAVYNAPERDVEMVSIPGRSGAFALDKGRFENIEVSYPAGIFADNEADFAQAVSDFRNYLCSRNGYCRLVDEYNPEEYRMAIYKSGLDVSPAQLKAGEFDITFDCKPQRWLMSGEDAVTMGEWGDTETASGSIATFEGDEATGIKSLVVDIEPIQSGSGTPSPSNIRPISGYDSVVTSVSPTTSSSDATTYTTDLNGTRYGGTLDVVSGVLTVTHKFFNVTNTMLTNASYVSGASSSSSYYYNLANVIADSDKAPQSFTLDMGAWSNKMLARQGLYSDKTVEGFTVGGRYVSIRINSDKVSDTSGASLASYLTSLDIVYPLATPTTVQLTAQQVSALVGTNNVWANSGDVSVEYGENPNKIDNPTLFDSSPLLEVEGYGSINFNNYMIELENATMGNIVLAGAFSFASADAVINISPGSLNAGDTISIEFLLLEWMVFRNDSSVTSIGVDSTSDSATGVTTDMSGTYGHNYYTVFPRVSFINGTSSTLTNTTTVNGHYNTTNFTATIITTISYDATANTITINRTASNVPNQVKLTFSNSNSNVGETSGDSTKLVLGNPTYIDCEIGEAYRIESSGEVISLNQYIDLGSDLPKLEKGENLFALDNTITSLKVKPRWWKV